MMNEYKLKIVANPYFNGFAISLKIENISKYIPIRM